MGYVRRSFRARAAGAAIAAALVAGCSDAPRAPVFEGAHASCVATGRSAGYCDCMVDMMQEEFTAAEFEAIDAAVVSGRPPPEFTAAVAKVAGTCQ